MSESLRDQLAEEDPELLFADGFEGAILGLVVRCGMLPVVCYDVAKCLDILVAGGMSYEDADEYFAFNVEGAYVGERTPMWLRMVEAENAESSVQDPAFPT